MATAVLVVLASATILAVGASNLARPEAPSTTLPDLGVVGFNSLEETQTYSGWGSSHYLYLDFPELGYAIFRRKVTEALDQLGRFMQMKPAYVKISQFFFSGGAENNTVCLVCAEELNSEGAETDPEPTENGEPNRPQGESSRTLKSTQVFHEIEHESDLDPAMGRESDEVKLTKLEPEGLFSKSFGAVGGFFHRIGSWFW